MTIEIKQSTAHTFLLGPFVDKDDGVAVETGLATAMDNASSGIRLSKNGGNMADRNDSTAPVHDEDGWYTVVLDATDTNTLGLLQVEYTEVATALPAWKDFSVVTANYWDTKYSTDLFNVNVATMDADSIATGVIATDAIGTAAMAAGSISSGTIASGELTNIEDQIWDAILTGASHNVSTSAGRRLRQLETGLVLDSGTLDAATSNTADLETGVASTIDDFYNHNLLVITSLTGVGQVRVIVDYTGTGNIAIVSPPWVTTPDATSTYDVIVGYAHAETTSRTAHVGLAQAGATGSITLASDASAVTDFYKNDVVSIDSGTGAGQERIITAYNGSTKVATTEPDWTTDPDSTSNYIVEEALSVADIIAVHHSQPAADNLRDDYDGTGLTRANSTIGTVTAVTNDVNLLTATQTSIDAIETDTASLNDGAISELAVTQPATTPTLQNAVMLLYMALRNKTIVQTSGTDALEIHNNAGTLITSKLLTDDGDDYTEAQMT